MSNFIEPSQQPYEVCNMDRRGNWGSERSSHLLKFTQLRSCRVWFQSWAFLSNCSRGSLGAMSSIAAKIRMPYDEGNDPSILIVSQGTWCLHSSLVLIAWANQAPMCAKQVLSASAGCLASRATVLCFSFPEWLHQRSQSNNLSVQQSVGWIVFSLHWPVCTGAL